MVAVEHVCVSVEGTGRCSMVENSNKHNCPAAAPWGIVVFLIQRLHMSCFESPGKAVSFAQNLHTSGFVIDYYPVAVVEAVVCCYTAQAEQGNDFGLNHEADGSL